VECSDRELSNARASEIIEELLRRFTAKTCQFQRLTNISLKQWRGYVPRVRIHWGVDCDLPSRKIPFEGVNNLCAGWGLVFLQPDCPHYRLIRLESDVEKPGKASGERPSFMTADFVNLPASP